MITLEQVCEEYVNAKELPIARITESPTHWAIFPGILGGICGSHVRLVDKSSGETSLGFIPNYNWRPDVTVPERFRMGVWHRPDEPAPVDKKTTLDEACDTFFKRMPNAILAIWEIPDAWVFAPSMCMEYDECPTFLMCVDKPSGVLYESCICASDLDDDSRVQIPAQYTTRRLLSDVPADMVPYID